MADSQALVNAAGIRADAQRAATEGALMARRPLAGQPGGEIRTDADGGGGGAGAYQGGGGGARERQDEQASRRFTQPEQQPPPMGGRPGYGSGRTPAYGTPAYGMPASGQPGGPGAAYPGRPSLPARRPVPGYDLPPEPQVVDYDRPPAAPPRRFAPAVGITPASAPPPRRRNVRPFDLALLEPIPKESVRLWKSLVKGFPAYFHGEDLNRASFEFLRTLFAPEAEAARTISLEVKRKDDNSVEVREFAEAEVTIGTHAQNKLQVAGASVSRRHVRIVHDERGWCLVDQGSSNGTWLRGERLQPGYAYPLKSGEAFTVPGYEIHVRWAEGGPAPRLVSLRTAALRIEPGARFFETAPTHAVVAVVRMEPAGIRAFVEVDLPLAMLAVARILGPPGEPGAAAALSTSLKEGTLAPRPLAEVEKGVLELIFVRLLDAVQSSWGAEAELTFHLERLLDGTDPHLAESAAGIRQFIVATIGLDFDGRRDSVRLALPDGAVAALAPRFARRIARAGEHGLEIVERYRDLTALAEVELAGSVGKAMLTKGELKACVPGDVFVPDELTIAIEGNAIKGKVELRAVRGRGRARVMCNLAEFTGERILVEVAALEVAPHARSEVKPVSNEVEYDGAGAEGGGEGALSEEELAAAAGLDSGAEGSALLDDVPLPLVVELGRVSLTVRELAGLRRGQVLELGHDPQQPVSLVFEGHVIGAGKLVNVEGEIGVQITSLGR